MADTEDDALKQAIAGTELEIFSDAAGQDLPSEDGGDRSVEEMGTGLEGQREGDDDETGDGVVAAAAADGDGDDAAKDEEVDGDAEAADGEKDRDPKTGQFKVKTEETGDGKEKSATADETGTTRPPNARVPVGELITERKATKVALDRVKALEDQLAAKDTDIAAINRRLDDIAAGRTQPPQQQTTQQAPAKKDIFEDPDGFTAELEERVERKFTQRYVAADLKRTHDAKPELFEPAYKALTSLDRADPAARATVKKIWDSPTPGDDLIRWHTEQETLRDVAGDPAAYRERIATEERAKLAKDPEFLKSVAAAMRGDAAQVGDDGKPRTVVRMPRSLNGASGGQSSGAGRGAPVTIDNSDRGVFEDVMSGR